MFIRTERLFLRPAWPEDHDDLLAALLEEGEYARDHSSSPSTRLPADSSRVREYLVVERDPRLPVFMICLRGQRGAELVGAIGLVRAGSDAELRYWIVPHHRGNGYAGESVDAVLQHAAMLGHSRLVARHFPQEDDQRRVYEAAGFRPVHDMPAVALEDDDGDENAQFYVAQTDLPVFANAVPAAARSQMH